MEARPPGVEDVDLVDALASAWAIDVPGVEYVPKGFGSYHWVGGAYFLTVDDLARKPWLGRDPDSVFAGLQAALDTARLLHDEAGILGVVAPVATSAGASLFRVSARYALSVFMHVNGQAGGWGEEISPDERVELVGLLADIHRATPLVADRAPRRPIAIPAREALVDGLDTVGTSWSGGPFSELARAELDARAAEVAALLARFDSLAARMSGAPLVVTHGEPHPGNMVRTAHGLVLVDWDTVALAPPERDVWMLDDRTPAALDDYTAVAGHRIDRAAIELYRLAWLLTDIAAYTELLRGPHEANPDTEKTLRGLKISLSADAAPHRPPWRTT